MQLPQSTASRHLRILAEGDWVTRRRDGTSQRYRGAVTRQPEATRSLWLLLRNEIADSRNVAQDRRRLRDVVARRGSNARMMSKINNPSTVASGCNVHQPFT